MSYHLLILDIADDTHKFVSADSSRNTIVGKHIQKHTRNSCKNLITVHVSEVVVDFLKIINIHDKKSCMFIFLLNYIFCSGLNVLLIVQPCKRIRYCVLILRLYRSSKCLNPAHYSHGKHRYSVLVYRGGRYAARLYLTFRCIHITR